MANGKGTGIGEGVREGLTPWPFDKSRRVYGPKPKNVENWLYCFGPRACVVCGNEYLAYTYSARTCSGVCAYARNREFAKAWNKANPAKCREQNRRAAQRKRLRKLPTYAPGAVCAWIRGCALCAKEYPARTDNQRYCSHRCLNRAKNTSTRKRRWTARYKNARVKKCKTCDSLITRYSTSCIPCHMTAMQGIKAAADQRKARKRKLLKQARALRRVGFKKKTPRLAPCPICGAPRCDDPTQYISTSCVRCMGLIYAVLGFSNNTECGIDLTPSRVSEAIAYINANPEVRRSYQWLKEQKTKFQKARKLLNHPKQAA